MDSTHHYQHYQIALRYRSKGRGPTKDSSRALQGILNRDGFQQDSGVYRGDHYVARAGQLCTNLCCAQCVDKADNNRSFRAFHNVAFLEKDVEALTTGEQRVEREDNLRTVLGMAAASVSSIVSVAASFESIGTPSRGAAMSFPERKC